MSFTFNGINSDAMGLFVERYPERPFPSRKQTVYNIHGRSGDLVVDDGAFSNVTQKYEVYILGGAAGFQEKAKAVAYWFLNVSGYAQLTDSYDPTVYRRARFTGGASFVNSLNKYGRASLTFDCCPQRYPITEEKLYGNFELIVTVPTVNNIMDGLPLIKINRIDSGSAAVITTPAITISLPTTTATTNNVMVDFETRTVYTGAGDRIMPVVAGSWNPVGSGDTITVSDTNEISRGAYTVNTRRWYL